MSRRKQKHRRESLNRKLHIQQLESRQLMAADSLGVVRNNTLYIDTDRDRDAEIDLYYGLPDDVYVSGNWTGNWILENPGVVRKGAPDGLLHWYLDTDGDPGHEIDIAFGLPNDTPVAGDWDGDGKTNVGVVRKGAPDGLLHWYLDTDGDPEHEIEIAYGWPTDVPVTGDWNGDGRDDVGVVRSGASDGLLHWYLDTDRDPEHEIEIAYGLPEYQPIVGDWNGDGVDDPGATYINNVDGLMHWLLDIDRDSAAEFDVAYGRPGDIRLPGSYFFPEIEIDGVTHGQTVRLPDSDFELTGSTQTMVVRNQGSGWLALGAIETPVGFRLVKGTVSALPPGAFDTIIVQVDTATPGEHSGTLRIANGDGNESPFSIQLVGNVRSADIRVDGIVNGGALLVGHTTRGAQPPTAMITVRNHGTANAAIGNVQVVGNFQLAWGPSDTSLAPGESTTIAVNMPTGTNGQFVGELSFSTNDPADRVYRIRLDGSVAEPFALARVSYLAPDGTWRSINDGQTQPIDFGLHAVGDRPTITFKVVNAGNIRLTSGTVGATQGFVVVEGLARELSPPQSDTFTIRLDTDSPGLKNGTITFDTNGIPDGTFTIPIRGMVGTPDITVSTPSIDFGQLDYKKTPAVRSFTVRNDGDGPLRFNVLQPLPKGYSTTNGSSFVVQPGKSVSVNIRLNTSVAGYRNGDLVLSTNDPDEPTRVVRLTGVVAPFFEVQNRLLANGTRELRIKNQTDASQTFRLTWKASSVVFQNAPPSATIPAGATVVYVYRLQNPQTGDLLRFDTSDPTKPLWKVTWNSFGGIIGFG